MDSEIPDITKFLRDETKDNLVVYEVSFLFCLIKCLNSLSE